jgi:hypothetical protein
VTQNSPIDNVIDHLQGARRSGPGWVAKCAHHDDRHASLSIKEGTDGRVLLHCFRGCASADVVVSAGLAWVDLFPPGNRERVKARTWLGVIPMGPNGRPALECMGDDRTAAMLGEFARQAKARHRLDQPMAATLKALAAAVGVSSERLTEAVRAALATEESA